MTNNGAIIGISDHGGWAIFVTVSHDGTLFDRRRVELVDDSLPAIPHHHEAQMMPIARAVELVERVRESAERHSVLALNEIAAAIPQIDGIALRACPLLPATIAERIRDARARNIADWVMYRKALAFAAETRGWTVHWYDAKRVLASVDSRVVDLRAQLGPPWTQEHKVAMAAALLAAEGAFTLSP